MAGERLAQIGSLKTVASIRRPTANEQAEESEKAGEELPSGHRSRRAAIRDSRALQYAMGIGWRLGWPELVSVLRRSPAFGARRRVLPRFQTHRGCESVSAPPARSWRKR
jgi:hypothetical protein